MGGRRAWGAGSAKPHPPAPPEPEAHDVSRPQAGLRVGNFAAGKPRMSAAPLVQANKSTAPASPRQARCLAPQGRPPPPLAAANPVGRHKLSDASPTRVEVHAFALTGSASRLASTRNSIAGDPSELRILGGRVDGGGATSQQQQLSSHALQGAISSSRRSSRLSAELSESDMPLAAMAGSLMTSSNASPSSQAVSLNSSASHLPVPPPAAPFCWSPERAAARLNPSEVALLRSSLAELDLLPPGAEGSALGVPDASSSSGAAAVDAAAAAAEDAGQPHFPDQMMLQELQARLGRLNSSKRQILLEVLQKIEAVPADAAAAHGAAAAAEQLVQSSLHSSLASSRRTSYASAASRRSSRASEPGQIPSSTAADGHTLPEAQQHKLPEPPAPAPVPAPAAAAAGATYPAISPGRGTALERLAALKGKAGAAGLLSPRQALEAETSFAGEALAELAAEGTLQQGGLPPKMQASSPGPSRLQPASSASSTGDGGVLRHMPSLVMHAGHAEAPGHGAGGHDSLLMYEQQQQQQQQRQAAPTTSGAAITPHAQAGAGALDSLDAARFEADATAASAQTAARGSGSGGFAMPALPAGRVLEVLIHTTHGDAHYVGLSGIEIFDAEGQLVTVRDPKVQVTADPHSINVLPEYGSDPRTPDKLLDGVCMTTDDAHVWLTPFTSSGRHTVRITLDAPVTLGALRFWNYNKSRIHSLRGAKDVDILLDGTSIFRGELRQAPGSAAEALQHAELILFTEDSLALAALELFDQRYLRQLEASPPDTGVGTASAGGAAAAAAGGASAGSPVLQRWGSGVVGQLDLVTATPVAAPLESVTGGRPLTTAFSASPDVALSLAERLHSGQGASTSGAATEPQHRLLLRCKQLALVVLDTWGDSHFVGLSGLEVVGGSQGSALPLAPAQLWADPPDLNVFPGHSGDVRVLANLLDGTSNTTDDRHMWLAPIKRQLSSTAQAASPPPPGGLAVPDSLRRTHNVLTVTLGSEPVPLAGLRVWNYNKSSADTARGIKRLLVLADGIEVSPPGGVLLRRAPGTAAVDFGQFVPLSLAWCSAAAASAEHPAATVTDSRHSGQQPAAAAAQQQQQQVSGTRLKQGPQGSGGSFSSKQQAAAAHAVAAAQHLAAAQHAQQQAAAQQPAALQWDETAAWVCNMPDPLAALQYLQRSGPWRWTSTLVQLAEGFSTPVPCGFRLRLAILTSWGDPHYVGLSGIEVTDAVQGVLPLAPSQVHATPSSVALLPGMAADVRTPDKLVDGDNSGAATHSWLAPLLVGEECNSVCITFEAPVLLGSVRVWNYAKSPARGVQEAELYLDEQLVWKGLLQRAPEGAAAVTADFSQLLCFTEEAAATAAAAAAAATHSTLSGLRRRVSKVTASSSAAAPPGDAISDWMTTDRVMLVNDGQFVTGAEAGEAAAPPPSRPVTAVVE